MKCQAATSSSFAQNEHLRKSKKLSLMDERLTHPIPRWSLKQVGPPSIWPEHTGKGLPFHRVSATIVYLCAYSTNLRQRTWNLHWTVVRAITPLSHPVPA